MPLIPQTWLQEFNVTATTGPNDPDIIQLANGNILVSWTSSDPARPGASGGSDTIGQIFDPLGNAVGGPFRINQGFFADDEIDMDLAALPGSGAGGAFIAVYEDVETTGTPLRFNVYNAAGASIFTGTIESDGNGVTEPNFRNPHVAVSSATSALVVYEQTIGGTTTVVGRIIDPTTGTIGAQIPMIAFPGGDFDPDVTALTNGNYVITATNDEAGDNRIIIRIVNSAGGNVLGVTPIAATDGDTFSDTEASVTALAGGGFVVAYTDVDSNDTDVTLAVFNAAGTQVGTGNVILPNSATNLTNEASITGLSDGTFIVIVDDDQADNMVATHFDATGASLGNFVFSGPGTTPSVTDLGDGRFAVTWQSLDATGGVRMEILDTRDFVNPAGVYTPDQWQVGTVGDDVFTADSDSEFVAAHDGNDTVTESGQIRTYLMGNGDDRLNVASGINSDIHDGGAGNDTIDWSASFVSAGTFNLATGKATSGASTENMISFENLTGTTNNDNITGTAGANILIGLAGNDIIDGGTGADTMAGGDGNDVYGVRDATDIVDETGATGIDTVNATVTVNLSDAAHFKGNVENVTLVGVASISATGNALANLLIGNANNNTLNGLGAADIMRGLAGNDLYGVENAGDVVDESVAGSGGIDTVNATVTVSLLDAVHFKGDIENVSLFGVSNINATGNNLGNVLIGNAANNTLNGNGGADTMRGLAGNDLYGVHDITDLVDEAVAGSAGIDTVNSTVNMSLVAVAGAAVALGAVENISLFGAGNTFAFGNALANTLIGNGGNNTLAGGLGNDTLTGNAGNDTFVFNTAPNAATNMDNITDMNQAGNDTIHLENAVFAGLAAGALAAGAFVSNGTGLAGDADDRIIYNIATGQLFFDSNGNAAGGSVQFALLDAGLAMSATDFFVI